VSEPIKQHYIPRSYLKNFAIRKGKNNYFVDVYLKKDEVLREQIDTRTICYEKHLYTLHNTNDSEKYALELYYANNVDNEFQNIYKLLVDKKKKILTKDEKLKVLYVSLSLYFRTPIHLNNSNSFTDLIFERLRLNADQNGIIMTSMFGDRNEVHIDELNELKKIEKEKAKKKFHIQHLEKWFDFVEHKYQSTINVIEIQDKDAHLITSDNPVVIREWRTTEFKGLFNPDNVITLRLDTKHFLEIHPTAIAQNEYEIQRFVHDRDYVFTTNAITEQNATNLLIGKRKTIDQHFNIQNEYENSKNGQVFVDKAVFKAKSLKELLRVTETYGAKSKEMVSQLKLMYLHPHFKGDQQIEKYAAEYKKMGLW
jgi:hypothetical protein